MAFVQNQEITMSENVGYITELIAKQNNNKNATRVSATIYGG